jgi:hypothetical protein
MKNEQKWTENAKKCIKTWINREKFNSRKIYDILKKFKKQLNRPVAKGGRVAWGARPSYFEQKIGKKYLFFLKNNYLNSKNRNLYTRAPPIWNLWLRHCTKHSNKS